MKRTCFGEATTVQRERSKSFGQTTHIAGWPTVYDMDAITGAEELHEFQLSERNKPKNERSADGERVRRRNVIKIKLHSSHCTSLLTRWLRIGYKEIDIKEADTAFPI